MARKKDAEDAPVGYASDHPAVLASLKAMKLERHGWAALRDECYEWLRVVQFVDPGAGSNVGERNIDWYTTRSKGKYVYHHYRIRLKGPWPDREGMALNHAPSTLQEALTSPLLAAAIVKRDEMRSRLVAKYGEPSQGGPNGRYAHIRLILEATPEGRFKLEHHKKAIQVIASMARTAEAYARDEWSPLCGRETHEALRAQPDRVKLVASGITTHEALALIASRQPGRAPIKADPFRHVTPVRAHIRGGVQLSEDLKLEIGLMVESGVSPDDVVDAVRAFALSLVESVPTTEKVAA